MTRIKQPSSAYLLTCTMIMGLNRQLLSAIIAYFNYIFKRVKPGINFMKQKYAYTLITMIFSVLLSNAVADLMTQNANSALSKPVSPDL